jgi:L-fuconolactonase
MNPGPHATVRPAWLALREEPILEPELQIVDAHHHLWDRPQARYMFDELNGDIGSGHNVVATVYVQCRSMYTADAPPAMQPVGEVEFANGVAARYASGLYGASRGCAGIIGCVDLMLGDAVQPVIERMRAVAADRLVGIRNTTAWHSHPAVLSNSMPPPAGLLASAAFYAGARHLAGHGLGLDIWAYHTQLDDVLALVQKLPQLHFVLDHIGGPLGVGPYASEGSREQAIADWRAGMRALARHHNLSVKIGGFGLKVMGNTYDTAALPPSSDTLARDWRPYVEFVIDTFGPGRCMFESNFPVDKGMFSYPVLWNAFKKLSAGYTAQERRQLFSATARSIYKLDLVRKASWPHAASTSIGGLSL